MKQKRQMSVNKIRLMLLSIVAMQYSNFFCFFFSQVSFVLSEAELPENFQDMDFTNTTFVDSIARRAMKRLHDELDRDDDGNVSPSEGATYRKEFFTSGPSNLPGFATDKDGRITEEEFWESWVRSAVHNWTATEVSAWLSKEVDLPQYASKFLQYGISGAAMPILANNTSLVLSLVDGIKEHRLKLWLKAMESVVCGYKAKSTLLKDTLLTISIVLALGGLAYAAHVRRTAAAAMAEMQRKLDNLQNEMQKLDEEDPWMKNLTPDPEERVNSLESQENNSSRSSLCSESELLTRVQELQEELSDTRMLLDRAEERLSDQRWSPPSRLITCLKNTHQVEVKLHEVKRTQAQKKVEQAKSQFLKIKKKSSIFTSVQLIHSQQMDSFDLHIQTAKNLLREVQRDNQDYRRRWRELEGICSCYFMSTSHVGAGYGDKGKSPILKLKLSTGDGLSFKTIAESDTSSLYDNMLGDIPDGLAMTDLTIEDSDTESNISLKTLQSCPTLIQYQHQSPDHRRSEPILRYYRPSPSHSNVRANSAPVVMKSSSNLKSPSPIPEVIESPNSEKNRRPPKKRLSPKPTGSKDVAMPCVVTTPEISATGRKHHSPSRTASLGPGDVTLALPKRKILCSNSLPDLTVGAEQPSSKLHTGDRLKLSPVVNKREEISKSPKKLGGMRKIFRRKTKGLKQQ